MTISFRRLYKIIFGLLLILIILLATVLTEARGDFLDIITLDIGEGDAILIKTPYGQNILIDGGPDNQVINCLGKNLSFFDHTIHLMISSHPDQDHITGLIEAMRRYEVKKIFYTGVLHNLPAYDVWLSEINQRKIPAEIVQAGYVLNLGPDLKLEILAPDKNMNGLAVEDSNMSSIVAMLVYKNNKFLFTGDAPLEMEDKLIEQGVDLKSDVLKVGHHGSKGSTGQEFLAVVQPRYAVISVGENDYGHPNLRVLKNLTEIGADILRTDQLGNVKLRSDGERVWLMN